MANQLFNKLVQKLSHLDPKKLASVIEFVEKMESNDSISKKLLTKVKGEPEFGSAKDKYILSDDFDAPLQDFNDYVK
ncbi:MAG: DUF2281 domain-containing protein [Chloroherpetonaceae bacterium]|nr:DUF2281 domain-containing protein [Chloroherpetonaceae bacterium]